MANKILIISAAPTGYRRGGVALEQGTNLFDLEQFSEEQLAQLENDPRITLAEGDAGQAGATADSQGTVDAERLAELVAHIQGLDRDNAELWKGDGTPKASAFPNGTSAEERAAAWEAFSQQLDEA